MTRKRRMFDIDLPEGEQPDDTPTPATGPSARRGPMATAIGEAGESLRQRAAIEADIRAENDALAHEFVRLKGLGLVTDMVPVEAVYTTRLGRDRPRTGDLDLGDLKESIRAIGLSNPIRVVPDGAGGYELVQGLRRLTAYRELWAETGDERWQRIPAGLMPAGETLDTLYRRMVDENMVRKDVSFAEMANLARAYAEDGVEGCADLDEAVNRLFASAGAQKRSYVRRFAFLMRVLEKHLNHPAAIPRALGLDLADRLEANPDAVRALVNTLRDAAPYDAREEVAVLRRFLEALPAAAPARAPGRARGAPRRGRVSLAVPVGPGVRATATAGKVELRADVDFSALDRHRLERAIEAFFAELARG